MLCVAFMSIATQQPQLWNGSWSLHCQQHGLRQADTALALEELDPAEEAKGNCLRSVGWGDGHQSVLHG